MSRYTSICKALDLAEAVSKMIGRDGETGEEWETVVQDLRDIAKDVRYGGRWDGDFEAMAQALIHCTKTGQECMICPYRELRFEGGCKNQIKRDAAAAIRQMGKDAREQREEIRNLKQAAAERAIMIERLEMYISEENLQEARETAQWQIDDMRRENRPPERFPWEE